MVILREKHAIAVGLSWSVMVAAATFGLLFAMSTVPAAAQEPVVITGGEGVTSRELVLPLGKAAIIELPRAASDVLVSEPRIVDTVIRSPRRVYVMGREAGQANAFFFDERDNQILNLEIRVEPDGKVISDMITKLMPSSRITVESLGGSIALHGRADSAVDAQRAVEIAQRFTGGAEVMNMIEVREPGQVMLKVRIVEMRRTLSRQLGVDLNGVAQINDAAIDFAVQTAGPVGIGLNSVIETGGIGSRLSDLDIALDVFEQNGLVKTLAEPSLIALSGERAEFLAGGQVAYAVVDNFGRAQVQFADFGVQLNFQPTIRSKGSISMMLETEVSEVNEALGTTLGGSTVIDPVTGEPITAIGSTVPGFSTRRAMTTVDLPSGASLAIAGLLQEDIQEVVDGVPALKEAPILGQLFRSQEFQSEQTELVVIATPYLVEPTTLAALTDPAQGSRPAGLARSVLLGRLEAAYGVRSRGVQEATLDGPLGFILD